MTHKGAAGCFSEDAKKKCVNAMEVRELLYLLLLYLTEAPMDSSSSLQFTKACARLNFFDFYRPQGSLLILLQQPNKPTLELESNIVFMQY